MNTNYKSYFHLALFAVLAVGFFALSAPMAFAVTSPSCTFSRDLQMGVIGEDVRCLQQYLNANGYVISTTGAGAPGKETGEYKSLTQAAVIKWQIANNLSPASGYFGPKSRQAYNALVSGGSVTPTPNTPSNTGNAAQDALMKQILELQQKMKNQTTTTVTKPVASSVAGKLKSITTALRDAEEEVADNDDADEYDEAVDSLVEARDYFYRAVLAYVGGDADEASEYLDDVDSYIEDALDAVGIASEEDEAEEALDDVKDRLDDAEAEIEEADEDGEDVGESEDLLDEARDVIDDAEDALDDEDYDEVMDLVDEADNLIDDALDAIGEDSSGSDVEDMLDDARKELKSVRKQVNAAEDDGDDMDDAQDYLDEAEDLLDDAEDAIDDGDEDEAEDLIDEALDLIADAEDEL
ncbi:MAG: peptidoglycan-binding domain-containing protein [Candidatus Paceibacteria bacterium]